MYQFQGDRYWTNTLQHIGVGLTEEEARQRIFEHCVDAIRLYDVTRLYRQANAQVGKEGLKGAILTTSAATSTSSALPLGRRTRSNLRPRGEGLCLVFRSPQHMDTMWRVSVAPSLWNQRRPLASIQSLRCAIPESARLVRPRAR